jgi:serine/threonine protein kinase
LPSSITPQITMTQQTQQLIKDRYRILETIGQGGFGKTYKAVDTSHPQNKLCVIKQFTFQGSNKDTAVDLFYKEAEHLKALGTHDQIPTLIDCFDENGQIYLVQQYIDGQNLEEELATEGVFNQQKIKELLNSLLPVLDFLHTGSQPIIHRDIKPANIIRRRSDGQFVLVDFGAVKVASETLLAKTGTSIGSPEYVAPEQLRGKPTFASDIYGLGVTCIHLLTNNSPWMLQNNDGDWCWRSFLNGNTVDGQLVNVLDKLIEPRLSGRYSSAAGVMNSLSKGEIVSYQPEVISEREIKPRSFFSGIIKRLPVLVVTGSGVTVGAIIAPFLASTLRSLWEKLSELRKLGNSPFSFSMARQVSRLLQITDALLSFMMIGCFLFVMSKTLEDSHNGLDAITVVGLAATRMGLFLLMFGAIKGVLMWVLT